MITDYESLLCITEGGRLWWLLKDVLRLGAGFLSGRNDQTLETLLRAPDHRTLVNEQILIGAFDDTRLTIERPVTLERDEDCYVDAEGFLDWFSLYIAKTQAETLFPSELASEVRMANSKTAASPSPISSQEFESLTIALEDWFDKNLEDLPETIRQRVERDFSPIPWGDLSAAQRRHLVLQMDYQHDPATEQERQFWWDFFARMSELKAEIAKWESVATPTASDISLQESRLKELQQELDRMELQQRQARGDYYPERKGLDADKVSTPITTDFIAYMKALAALREIWAATPEELAAWIFLGPDMGGIAAYRNANELNPPPEFFFGYYCCCKDYVSPLMTCWFRKEDIDRFVPVDRYITGTALIERWSDHPGLRPEAFIRAKIAEARLQDMHPTFGYTRGSDPDDPNLPPLSDALFKISHIEQVEIEDGLCSAPAQLCSDAQGGVPEMGGRPKEPLGESIEKAYLHLRSEGNTYPLQPRNIKDFMKCLKSLANDNDNSKEFKDVRTYLAERIKEAKITRAGKCSVITHDRKKGSWTNPGKEYSQESVAKQLAALRKKYPLPS